MKKIKDRMTLGIVSGLFGTILKIASDEVFLRMKISKRSFRETASGVWVSSRRQAKNPSGQLLGTIMDLGLGMMGSIAHECPPHKPTSSDTRSMAASTWDSKKGTSREVPRTIFR